MSESAKITVRDAEPDPTRLMLVEDLPYEKAFTGRVGSVAGVFVRLYSGQVASLSRPGHAWTTGAGRIVQLDSYVTLDEVVVTKVAA